MKKQLRELFDEKLSYMKENIEYFYEDIQDMNNEDIHITKAFLFQELCVEIADFQTKSDGLLIQLANSADKTTKEELMNDKLDYTAQLTLLVQPFM